MKGCIIKESEELQNLTIISKAHQQLKTAFLAGRQAANILVNVFVLKKDSHEVTFFGGAG